jgi:hypothetical protein
MQNGTSSSSSRFRLPTNPTILVGFAFVAGVQAKRLKCSDHLLFSASLQLSEVVKRTADESFSDAFGRDLQGFHAGDSV